MNIYTTSGRKKSLNYSLRLISFVSIAEPRIAAAKIILSRLFNILHLRNLSTIMYFDAYFNEPRLRVGFVRETPCVNKWEKKGG